MLVGEDPSGEAGPARAGRDHVTAARDEVVIRRGRVLVMSTMRVVSGDRVLGTVTTMRDRTALADLEREIGSFRSTAHVLRAQAHEFANQLHTISGLIQIGELDEVVRYVDAVSERGTPSTSPEHARAGPHDRGAAHGEGGRRPTSAASS